MSLTDRELQQLSNEGYDDAADEIATLRNDLADALDCKSGTGPTALSMVIAERDTLRTQLAASEEREKQLCRKSNSYVIENARLAERLAAAESRAKRLALLLRDVDDVALKIVSDYGVCDCIDNDGDAYQSQALRDELQAIRAALAEGEAG